MNIGTIATLCSLIDDKFSLVLSLSGKSHVHILLIINFSFSFYLKLPLVSFDKPPFETGIPERNCKFPARLHKSIGFINHYCRLNPSVNSRITLRDIELKIPADLSNLYTIPIFFRYDSNHKLPLHFRFSCNHSGMRINRHLGISTHRIAFGIKTRWKPCRFKRRRTRWGWFYTSTTFRIPGIGIRTPLQASTYEWSSKLVHDRIAFRIGHRMIKLKFLIDTNHGRRKFIKRRTAITSFHTLFTDFYIKSRTDTPRIYQIGDGVISTTSLIDDIIRLIARPAWDRNIKFVFPALNTKTGRQDKTRIFGWIDIITTQSPCRKTPCESRTTAILPIYRDRSIHIQFRRFCLRPAIPIHVHRNPIPSITQTFISDIASYDMFRLRLTVYDK